MWVFILLISALLVGGVILYGMLVYRSGHKTTVEMDLLLRQMRLTSRLRTGMSLQRDRLDAMDGFCANLLELWETKRRIVKEKFGYDIEEMEQPPASDVDLGKLLADIESNI